MRQPCAVVLIVLTALPVALFARQSQPSSTGTSQAAQDPLALTALQTALGSLSGPAAAVPTSILATGTYTRSATNVMQSLPIQIEALGLNDFRWDTTESDGTATIIVAGTSGWFQNASGSRALATGETFGRGVEIFPLLFISKWLNNAGVGVTWVGPDTVSGQSVNHITIIPPAATVSAPQPMAQCELYLNPETNIPVRVRVYQHPIDPRISTLLDIDFANYQQTNGALFPTSVTFSIGGHQISQIQLQSISLNASVSAGDFTRSAQ